MSQRLCVAALGVGLAAAVGSSSACSPAPPVVTPPAGSASAVASAPAPNAADPTLEKALAEAAAGVDDAQLAELLREHWRFHLESYPVGATRLGVRAFADRLTDASVAAIEQRHQRRVTLLAKARALPADKLSERDRITVQLLIEQLDRSVASHTACQFHLWNLSARSNPVTEHNHLPEVHKVETVADGLALLARYRAVAPSIDANIANLRQGVAGGLVANAESARRTLEMADKQLAQPMAEWPMLKPLAQKHDDWTAAQRDHFAQQLRSIVEQQIKPALTRYRDLLRDEIVPKGRDANHSGLSALPIGDACYRARVHANVTLPYDPAEVHRIGEQEIARLDGEIAALGKKALGTKTLKDTLAALRADKKLYFETAAQVQGAAEEILRDAKAAMPRYFGRLPKADCVVRPIPDYEAPFTTIAYYRPPHTDGSKPGEYFINVHAPETRPRFEARVLGVHEAIFGHHLQIAISQELGAVPAFRKHGHFTAYVEGWALYTERLGQEAGLYKTDLDVMGMLSFDAWRAARLVVDTGIHAQGWSRDRARRYMTEHTALSANNIDNEVDRYISWPGQALGYKMGQLEILRLRGEVEKALGERFSHADFHDAVLDAGALTLPLLRRRVLARLLPKPAPKPSP